MLDNGFSRACPNGNTMIDCYREPHYVTCGRCDGRGKVEWQDLGEFVEELSFRVYKLKKVGKEPKSFTELLKLARLVKRSLNDCDLCDGTGEVEA